MQALVQSVAVENGMSNLNLVEVELGSGFIGMFNHDQKAQWLLIASSPVRRFYDLLMVSVFQESHFKIPHASLARRLYGATLAQTIFYFRSFHGDSRATKHLVGAIHSIRCSWGCSADHENLGQVCFLW